MERKTFNKTPLLFINLAVALIFPGCGADYQFKQARRLEDKGFYVQATLKYDKIYKKYPDHPLSPEALYRLGRIYQKKLKLYSQATHYFQRLLENYGKSERWASAAKLGMFNSPDYFPLTKGSFWIEGDSQTGGHNMRAEWNCSEVSSGTFRIERLISAGSRRVARIERFYKKDNLELRESADPRGLSFTTILSYPVVEGNAWKSYKDGRPVIYKIVSKTVALKTKAGEFTNCLKISEMVPNLPGSVKYNYYAPEAGWVLTTTSLSGGNEHYSSELISYKINPE